MLHCYSYSLPIHICSRRRHIKPGTHSSMLKSAPHHTTPHHTKLAPCARVDRKNEQRHTLQTGSCTAQTRSDLCHSIKVSIILCVLSVDSFFASFVASVLWINFFMELTLTFWKIIICHKIWVKFKITYREKEFKVEEGEIIERSI